MQQINQIAEAAILGHGGASGAMGAGRDEGLQKSSSTKGRRGVKVAASHWAQIGVHESSG